MSKKGKGWLADECPDREAFHTHDPTEPSGYISWHEWAARKLTTHRSKRCPTCKLWVVWVPRISEVIDG